MVHAPALDRRCALNVIREIQSFNAGREPERLALKYRAMRASPFAFLRGTCHLFHDRLPRGGVLKTAPLAWACGDLHLQNFGSYKGDNRLVYFDINDFDEAALAPASWDLLRLLTSVRVCASGLQLTGTQARSLCGALLQCYGDALSAGKAYWVERDTAQGIVRELLDRLRNRARATFLDARTQRRGKKRLLIVDGKRALPASPSQRAAVIDFMNTFATTQCNPGFFEVLDVARRIAGTGSLGLERYAILVSGKGSPDGNYLLDLKQATPSSLVPHLKRSQPVWRSEAHRVVALQHRLQAVSMAFLQPVVLHGRPFVLRGLQPTEDRIALDRPGPTMAQLTHTLGEMGRLLAWAQLRSAGREGSAIADELIDFGRRKKWRGPMLALALECAAQVEKDALTFAAAFDDGAFDA
jgi:uncharacterized protein (DUF2252 family)